MELQLEVDRRCALKCVHCSNISREGALGYRLENVLELCRAMPFLMINLTGGEPLLRGDILAIVRSISAASRGTNIGLFTSGVMIRNGEVTPLTVSEASALTSVGLTSACLSVHDVSADVHDAMTATPGSLRATLASARALALCRVRIAAHVVVTQSNLANLESLAVSLHDTGFREIRFLRLARIGRAVESWGALAVDAESAEARLRALLERFSSREIEVSVSGFPLIAPCRPGPSACGCEAGARLLYVNADGDVFPCACFQRAPANRIAHVTSIARIVSYHKGLTQSQLACAGQCEQRGSS